MYSRLINRFEIPVRREHGIAYENSIPVPVSVTEFSIKGNIIPLTGRELMIVPEGDRFKEQIWVFTHGDLQDDDVITHTCKNYQVQTTEPWLGRFKRARAMRVDVGQLKQGNTADKVTNGDKDARTGGPNHEINI